MNKQSVGRGMFEEYVEAKQLKVTLPLEHRLSQVNPFKLASEYLVAHGS